MKANRNRLSAAYAVTPEQVIDLIEKKGLSTASSAKLVIVDGE